MQVTFLIVITLWTLNCIRFCDHIRKLYLFKFAKFYVDILLFDSEMQQFAINLIQNVFCNETWRILFKQNDKLYICGTLIVK